MADPITKPKVSTRPETRSERLERLREAVHSGTYSIPAMKVTASLVDEHLANSGDTHQRESEGPKQSSLPTEGAPT